MSLSTTLPSTSGALCLTLPSTSLRYAQDERSEKLCILSVGEAGVEGSRQAGQAQRDPKRNLHSDCTKIRQFALWFMVCDWMGIINTVIHM